MGFVLSCALSPIALFIVGNVWGWSAFKLVGGQILLSLLLLLFGSREARSKLLFDTTSVFKKRKWVNLLVLFAVVVAVGLPYIEFATANDVYQCVVKDWNGREAVVWSIMRYGLPLQDPYFYPGHSLRMYYPFLYYLMPAAVSTIAQGVGPAGSWVFGMIMVAVSLCWVIAEHLRVITRSAGTFLAAAFVTIFVGGFDWLIVVIQRGCRFLRGEVTQLPRHVDAWTSSLELRADTVCVAIIWAAPHVCAVALYLLLVRLMPVSSKKLGKAILAGVIMAAIFGFSPYVFIGVTAVLAMHFMRLLGRFVFGRKSRELLAGLVVMLIVSAVIMVPYAWDLEKADLSEGKGKVMWHVPKPSVPVFVGLFGDSAFWRLLDLPTFYFLEFGPLLILAVAGYYIAWKRKALGHQSWYLVTGAVGAVLIAGVIRSTGKFNDLGVRILLISQVWLALFCAVALGYLSSWKKRYRFAAGSLLFIGFLSAAWVVMCMGVSRFVLHYPSDRFPLYNACKYVYENTPDDAIIAVDPACSGVEMARRWMGRRMLVGSLFPGSLAYTDQELLMHILNLNRRFFSETVDEKVLQEVRRYNVSYALKKISKDKNGLGVSRTIYKNSDYVVLSLLEGEDLD